MIEAILVDEQDCMMMVWWLRLDYVDCRKKMNVMNLWVVEEEDPMVVLDYFDHHPDRHLRLISMMKHSNHVHRSRDPWVICP
jgi:hypothetical protein